MNSLLAEIVFEKRKEVDRIREGRMSTNRDNDILPIRDFKAAISVPSKINLIAEIKFASPLTGIIHKRKDLRCYRLRFGYTSVNNYWIYRAYFIHL